MIYFCSQKIEKKMINGMNKTFGSGDDGLKQSVKALNRRMDAVESILDKAKEILTLEEAARFLGMAKSTLYKLTHEQAIPYYKPNGKSRSSRGANS